MKDLRDTEDLTKHDVKPIGDEQTAGLLGPGDPSFRAFSGRLKFTVRRQKTYKDFSFPCPGEEVPATTHARKKARASER